MAEDDNQEGAKSYQVSKLQEKLIFYSNIRIFTAVDFKSPIY